MSRDNNRKIEHLEMLQADPGTDRQGDYFGEFRLLHRALPELDLEEIDTGVEFLGKRLSFPLLISSMTGGDHELLRRINRNLATAAEQCGVAMAVGSQRVMFGEPAARESFELRPYAPSTVLIANLGAVQLNCGLGPEACREAVEVLAADGLYLHLNPLQEAVQPEGDTCFAGLADRIGEAVAASPVPVLVKEVGAGLSPVDADLLLARGVHHLDVAGSGGTSWSRVEHHRAVVQAPGDRLGLLFEDWGIPTPRALALLAPLRERATLIASGGLRTGLDLAKAIVLGAAVGGFAGPLLGPARDSAEATVAAIERLRREFRTAMFLLGVPRVAFLRGRPDLVLDAPAWWGGE